MADINDIKDLMLGLPINIYLSLYYIIFIIFLYLIYKYFFLNKKEIVTIEIKEKIKREKKDFNKILYDFEEIFLKEKSEIFYSKLLEILRDILEEKGNKNLDKMTFEEISNLSINDSLKGLIKGIYYKEYMKYIEDGEELRRGYIEKIKKLII